MIAHASCQGPVASSPPGPPGAHGPGPVVRAQPAAGSLPVCVN
jgi:hypothetical protein